MIDCYRAIRGQVLVSQCTSLFCIVMCLTLHKMILLYSYRKKTVKKKIVIPVYYFFLIKYNVIYVRNLWSKYRLYLNLLLALNIILDAFKLYNV